MLKYDLDFSLFRFKIQKKQNKEKQHKDLIKLSVKKITFYDASSFLLNNRRQVSNRVRLFIIKQFHKLIKHI